MTNITQFSFAFPVADLIHISSDSLAVIVDRVASGENYKEVYIGNVRKYALSGTLEENNIQKFDCLRFLNNNSPKLLGGAPSPNFIFGLQTFFGL